jgi:hypothetical protein
VIVSTCGLRLVAAWPSCTSSMQFPIKLYVIPEMQIFVLASASVLFTLIMMCVLSFWLLVGGGESNMNVSQLGWCHTSGFCVLGCCFLLVRFEFHWGFMGCGLDVVWFWFRGGNGFCEQFNLLTEIIQSFFNCLCVMCGINCG